LELEYTIDERDRDAFLEYHAYHSAALHELRRRHVYGYGILLAIFAAIFWLFGETAVAISFLLLGPIWAAWWPSRTRRLARAQAEAFYRADPGGLRPGRHTVTLHGGVLSADALGEHRLPASAIQRVVQLPEHLLIYMGPIAALVVPRRRVVKGDLSAFSAELERQAPASRFE
jgi:hypothetical protein